MKRILALFLALTLFLPVLAFAELDEEELEFEEFDPDDIPEESSSDSGSIEMTDEMADELLKNPKATYLPVCFVDIDKEKVGREIYGINVLSSKGDLHKKLISHAVQEVVFALPNISWERRAELYKRYEGYGYKIKAYDYPTLNETGRRETPLFVRSRIGKGRGTFHGDIRRVFVDLIVDRAPEGQLQGVQDHHGHGGDGGTEDVVPFLAESRVAGFPEAPERAVPPEKGDFRHDASPGGCASQFN